MADENENISEPTDSAFDLIEASKAQHALAIFHLNMARINTILRVSSSGIAEDKRKVDSLHDRFQLALNDPEANAEANLKKEYERTDGVLIEFDRRELETLTAALGFSRFIVGDIHIYLHNVLCVAAWGAFEGYIQARFAELFNTHTQLLASDRKVTFKEVVGAGTSVIDLLVAKEIDFIGRKSFQDLQEYMGSTIHLQFSHEQSEKLRDLYFLRNVIAHSAGRLRGEQLSSVPIGVEVQDCELRIGREFLMKSISSIQDAVLEFDQRLCDRFPLQKTIQTN